MIRPENFYVVRTPLLPIDVNQQLNHVTKDTLAPVIKEIFRDGYLREAIYIASPELYQELNKWLQGEIKSEKDTRKLAAALYRYLLRMSSRCTPYGLFAGCATGEPADHTAIRLGSRHEHIKHCRLDMNYVAELAAAITAAPVIKTQLRYFPNNSLYAAGSHYRYAAYSIKNKVRSYYLTSVNKTPYLEKMLATATGRATLTDIRNSIISEADLIFPEEATAFTEELVQNQLLVSELEPTVTGEEFFTHFINRLKSLEHTETIVSTLSRIQNMLSDQQTGTEKYTLIHELVNSLLTDTGSKDLVQTDLYLSTTSNTLSHTVLNELSAQMGQLWKLARTDNNSDLQNFRQAFRQRYEEQEIPLSLALDTEAGIGYGHHNSSNTDPYQLPGQLMMYVSDLNNQVSAVLTDPLNVQVPQTGNLVVNSLIENGTNYSFDITSYINTIIAEGRFSTKALLLSAVNNNYKSTTSRLAVFNKDNDPDIRLKLYVLGL